MLLIGTYTFLVGSSYFMVGWYIGGRRCYSSTAGFYVVGCFFSLQSYDTYHGLTLPFPTLVLHFVRLSVVGSIISNQRPFTWAWVLLITSSVMISKHLPTAVVFKGQLALTIPAFTLALIVSWSSWSIAKFDDYLL